jgi:hypothetical protein
MHAHRADTWLSSRVRIHLLDFEVKSILRVELIDAGLGGMRLTEEEVEPPTP